MFTQRGPEDFITSDPSFLLDFLVGNDFVDPDIVWLLVGEERNFSVRSRPQPGLDKPWSTCQGVLDLLRDDALGLQDTRRLALEGLLSSQLSGGMLLSTLSQLTCEFEYHLSYDPEWDLDPLFISWL